jgi:subfamily B ATP-binding cassette protein HlyB/CyaB
VVSQPQSTTSAGQIPEGLKQRLSSRGHRRTLAMGNVLLPSGEHPGAVWIVLSGTLRSLASLPPQNTWRTIDRHRPNALVGWLGLLYDRPLEHLRAGEPCELLEIPASWFLEVWNSETDLQQWAAEQTPRVEAVALLHQLAHANHARSQQLEQWKHWISDVVWAVQDAPRPRSGGHWHQLEGQPLQPRWIWLPDTDMAALDAEIEQISSLSAIAPVTPEVLNLPRASGRRDIPIAICQALALHYGVPFLRDNIRDEVEGLLQRQTRLNLLNIGQLLSSLDLSVSLAEIPLGQLERIPTPAVLEHRGSIGCSSRNSVRCGFPPTTCWRPTATG